jgi:peptide/nickel transport system permease protein
LGGSRWVPASAGTTPEKPIVLNYILRRLAYGVLILVGVNLFTFILFFAVNTPDDMARLNIGGKRVTQEAIEKWKVERGYDKPLLFNGRETGTRQFTRTIFFERSVQLFAFNFGASDSGSGSVRRWRSRCRPTCSACWPPCAWRL